MQRVLTLRWYLPRVHLLVLLLRGQYKGPVLRAGVNPTNIIAVDEFKMTLLGKSCHMMGFSTLICNLFRSTSSDVRVLENIPPWERMYREGMDNEIYLVPLSERYKGATFASIFFDILKRSEGKVYLIGFAVEPMAFSMDTATAYYINLNPGPSHVINFEKNPLGIFISADSSSILQKDDDDEAVVTQVVNVTGIKVVAAMHDEFQPLDLADKSYVAPVVAKLEMDEERKRQSDEVDGEVAATVADINRVVTGEAQKMTQTVKKKKKSTVAQLTRQKSSQSRRLFHAVQASAAPSYSLLSAGGHVLICAFSDTNEPIGIAHLMENITDGDENRPLVILSPSIPQDWHTVVEYPHTYYVKGNARNLIDLQGCCYHRAHLIIVTQSGVEETVDPILADSGPIITTKLIESQFAGMKGRTPPTIVDLLFETNYTFVQLQHRHIPTERATLLPKSADPFRDTKSRESYSGPSGGGAAPLPGILGKLAAAAGGPPEAAAQDGISGKFGTIQASQAAEDPRFASGQLLVSTAITSLLVQTILNPASVGVVQALVAAQSTLCTTEGWEYMSYEHVVRELLLHRGLIPLAIVRSMDFENDEKKDMTKMDPSDMAPSFVWTAPCGDSKMYPRDRIMCIMMSDAKL